MPILTSRQPAVPVAKEVVEVDAPAIAELVAEISAKVLVVAIVLLAAEIHAVECVQKAINTNERHQSARIHKYGVSVLTAHAAMI